MPTEKRPDGALVPLPDRTLGPARSLAERTLASLTDRQPAAPPETRDDNLHREAGKELMKAGWEYHPGVAWPSAVAARVVAAGHAGVLEYVGRPHGGRCEVPHDHTITRYCSHGVWRRETRASLPWTRTKQARLLGEVCPCPLRMIVSEFHPVTAVDDLRRTWLPEMRAWLDDYLSQQPVCPCTPLLRLGTSLGPDGQPVEALAIVVHDVARCSVRGELVRTTVSPKQGA